MNRRQFASRMMIAGAGLAVGLPTLARAAADPGKEFFHPSKKPASGEHSVDVVVVGAGLSGLSAARKLTRAGKSVLVLEARPRIGGRMFLSKTIEDGVLDWGGQWVGPTQTAILGLLDELKIGRFDSYEEGRSLLSWNGTKVDFDGNVSKVLAGVYGATAEDREGQTKLWNDFMAIAKTVPAATPWTAPNAKALDAQTLQTWLDANSKIPYTQFPMSMQARIGGSGGFEPSQASLLHMAWTQVVGPQAEIPEQWLMHGGAGQVPARLAAELSEKIVLNAPVLAVSQETAGVSVQTANLKIKGKAVIIAIPPPLRAGIQFSPALPAMHSGLIQRAPMGSMAKVHCVYPTAFWRPQGLSGSGAGNLKTLEFIADSSPPSGKPGILTSFIAAARNIELSSVTREEVQAAVIADMVYYFGPEAAKPVEFFHYNWNEQPWTGGAFTNYMPPGVWTTYGPAWREPVGRIFWAGTEVSTRWPGYFDGAVRAGLEAAESSLAKMG